MREANGAPGPGGLHLGRPHNKQNLCTKLFRCPLKLAISRQLEFTIRARAPHLIEPERPCSPMAPLEDFVRGAIVIKKFANEHVSLQFKIWHKYM
mgnify:FL=1